MKSFILVLLICGISIFKLSAQEKINFIQADKLSYKFFSEAKWDSVISVGKQSLEANIDFYFLRVRLGKAYFEMQNYTRSLEHFEKAVSLNANEEFTLSHLYYCYKNLGRNLEAYHIYRKYKDIIGKTISGNFINNISADAVIIDNKNNYQINSLTENQTNEWAELNILNRMKYGGLGMSYFVWKNILLKNYIGALNIDNNKQVRIFNENISDKYKLYQNDFYISSEILLPKGIRVEPAFHYILVDFSTLFSKFDTALNKVTQDYKNVYLKNYASSLMLKKHFSYFGIGITGAFSSLNNARQRSVGIDLSVYPKGNLDLYFISKLTYHKERKNSNFIVEQKIGKKFHKYLWAELSATLGTVKNFSEENSFIVHNISDAVKQRYGLSVILPLKLLQVNLKYQYLIRETEYQYFSNGVKSDHFNYDNHYILLGLNKKF